MRQYNNLQPLWMSFYAGELYEDVGRNWKGFGLKYLFLLLTLTWMPTTMSFSSRFDTWVDEHLPGIIEEAPELTIENGKLSTNPRRPFIINDPSSGSPYIIIDVSGAYTSLDETEASILVLEDSFLWRQDDGQVQAVPIFRDVQDTIVFNEDTLYQLFDFFKSSLPIFLYPAGVLLALVYRLVQICIYAGIGIFFAQYVNTQLPYETLLRLTAISITPAVILDTLHIILDANMPYWWFICFMLSMGYLYFAVKVNCLAETEAQVAATDEELHQ